MVYTWESLPVEKTTSGERRAVFDSYTATVDRLETHVTTVNVGMASHAAHKHPDKELVYVREGVVEATINGISRRANAGSVIFFASQRPARRAKCWRNTGQLFRAALDVARPGWLAMRNTLWYTHRFLRERRSHEDTHQLSSIVQCVLGECRDATSGNEHVAHLEANFSSSCSYAGATRTRAQPNPLPAVRRSRFPGL